VQETCIALALPYPCTHVSDDWLQTMYVPDLELDGCTILPAHSLCQKGSYIWLVLVLSSCMWIRTADGALSIVFKLVFDEAERNADVCQQHIDAWQAYLDFPTDDSPVSRQNVRSHTYLAAQVWSWPRYSWQSNTCDRKDKPLLVASMHMWENFNSIPSTSPDQEIRALASQVASSNIATLIHSGRCRAWHFGLELSFLCVRLYLPAWPHASFVSSTAIEGKSTAVVSESVLHLSPTSIVVGSFLYK